MNARRFVTLLGIVLCAFGLPPSYAGDTPPAQFVGLRCHVVYIDPSDPSETSGAILVCQIVDAPDPMGTGSASLAGAGDAVFAPDSLLQLLTAPSNTLQLAQSPQHGPLDTPTPTP